MYISVAPLLPLLLVLSVLPFDPVRGQTPTLSNANLTFAVYSDSACTVLNVSPRTISITSPIPFTDSPIFQKCSSTSSTQLQAEGYSFYTGYCNPGPGYYPGYRAVTLRLWDTASSDVTCSYSGPNLSVWTFQAQFPVNATLSACVPVASFVHYVGSALNYTLYNGFYAQGSCSPSANYTPNSNDSTKRHRLHTIMLFGLSLLFVLVLV